MTPVATAQPIRHACSTGSSRGTFTAATAGTTVCVANVPVRSTGVSTLPSSRSSRPAAAGGCLHCRGAPRRQVGHSPQAVFQPMHHAVTGREPVDAVADRFDRARTLVAEQDRVRVAPAVLLDHVQVAVADAGRLDAHEHLAGLGLRDLDLLERDAVARAEDYTALSQDRSRSRMEWPPARARLRSISAIRFWISSSTPRCPPTASA